MNYSISPDLLVPLSKSILLGSFAWTLVKSMRGTIDLQTCFERLAIGLISILTFKQAVVFLDQLSNQLSGFVLSLQTGPTLRELLFDSFKDAANAPTKSGGSTILNIPSLVEQAWRTGVWGVMTAIVEGTFIVTYFALECAKNVLWQTLVVLFPLAAAVVPVFPKMFLNSLVYAVELSLWFPVLQLVEKISGAIGKVHLTQEGSWGLYIVGTQLVSIVLMLLIPSLTHRFLSGAFSGDFDSQASLIRWSKISFTKALGAFK